MLILARKQGQKVFARVGDVVIEVVVVEIQRGRVKLGFAAPDAVSILREELVPAKTEESPRVN